MHTFFALVLCLSLLPASLALATNKRNAIDTSRQSPNHGVVNWLFSLFRRDNDVCVEDGFYQFVSNSTTGQAFCQAYYDYPEQTVTVDYTPAR